jgi:hypothetical protein
MVPLNFSTKLLNLSDPRAVRVAEVFMAPSDCRSLAQVLEAGGENCREPLPRSGGNDIRQVATRTSSHRGNAALAEGAKVTTLLSKPAIAPRAHLLDVPEYFWHTLDFILQDGTGYQTQPEWKMTRGTGATICHKSRGNSRVVPPAPPD